MRFGSITGDSLICAIADFGVKRVLEIGTLVGHSAITMAANLPEDGIVHTIEINPESAELAMANIRLANLTRKVIVHVGDALDVIPLLVGEFDLIYIDAEKSQYLKYIKSSECHLKENGVVIADNVKRFASEVKDYLEYMRSSGKYRSQYKDLGFDGMEISVRRKSEQEFKPDPGLTGNFP